MDKDTKLSCKRYKDKKAKLSIHNYLKWLRMLKHQRIIKMFSKSFKKRKYNARLVRITRKIFLRR